MQEAGKMLPGGHVLTKKVNLARVAIRFGDFRVRLIYGLSTPQKADLPSPTSVSTPSQPALMPGDP